MRSIDRRHPIAAILYLAVMTVISMATLHPLVSSTVLVSGMALYLALTDGARLLKSLKWSLPLMLLITVTNPIFVHRGATVLFYINDTPVTLEAIAYGGATALMLGGAFYWFACVSRVMCDDKIVCVMGKRFPKTALVLSMTLGFVPVMAKTAADIDDAQASLGLYDNAGIAEKIRAKLNVFSVLVSQSMEGSIETADSMLARGYTLPDRHSYTEYVFTRHDAVFCAAVIVFAVLTAIFGSMSEGFDFYPLLSPISFGLYDLLFYSAVAVMALISIIPEVYEKLKWHFLK